MDVRRTAVVKLAVSDEQRDALHRTAEQYLYCANRTADYCWSDVSYTECKTNKRQVRDALYRRSRPSASGTSPEVLHEYVEYKAPERGVAVEQVESSHTSQRCSRTDCGFTHGDNRHGEQFRCQKCGYEVNADYNAAKNIGIRYGRKRTHSLRSSPTSGSGDAEVDLRINGGTLNGESYQPIAGD